MNNNIRLKLLIECLPDITHTTVSTKHFLICFALISKLNATEHKPNIFHGQGKQLTDLTSKYQAHGKEQQANRKDWAETVV